MESIAEEQTARYQERLKGSGVVLVLAAAAGYRLGALLVTRWFPDTPV
jgi:hypothetical protein